MATIYTTGDGKQYQSEDGTLLVLAASLAETLITDRTEHDVARWRELHDKGWAAMTTSERSEWMGEMKGRYSFTDMNRVEGAVETLSARFINDGYLTTPLSVKTDWNRWSVPTKTDMERYLGNVETLRGLITVYPSTPATPTINQRMNYKRANDIEKILVDLDDILTKIPNSRFYAGEIYSGEV